MDLDNSITNIDEKIFQKMIFLYNCVENGWSVKKNKSYYIFRKKHKNKEEYFDDEYITNFIQENIDTKNIIQKICNNINSTN